MKDIITSKDRISASTRFGIAMLKIAIRNHNAEAAGKILNGKKYDRPVQFRSEKLIKAAKGHG